MRADTLLWYRQPAQRWTEALPVGNGRLGAMVFGGVEYERLALNTDTLWTGRPHTYTHLGALERLPGVRRLIFAGQYAEAIRLADEHLLSEPRCLQAYQPLGDLWLDFPDHQETTDYRRELDLEEGVARVSYRLDQTTYTREIFCSAPDQALVVRLPCDRPSGLSFEVRLSSPHENRVEAAEGPGLILRGQWVGDGKERPLIAPVEGPGLPFEARLAMRAEGAGASLWPAASEGGIAVSGADGATLLLVAATGYKNEQDISGDPAAICARDQAGTAGKGYLALRAAHVADYRRLFGRVSIDLGSGRAAERPAGASPLGEPPTGERLEAFRAGAADPGLAALYFQYGRYLLIACSRPGTQPANLQGIWNEELTPAWGSKWTTNINTQMNYWPADVCNLAECHTPLLALIERRVPPGRETARVHYGCRGWVLHHNTDLWGNTAAVENANPWGMWPAGSGWLCAHLWEHYAFSGEREYLAQAYPVLKEAALFYLDYLVADPAHGWLLTCPSVSPENTFRTADGRESGLCAGPAMDLQIIHELFGHVVEAARQLDVDAELCAQLQAALARLAPLQVGRFGQLMEWSEDWDEVEPGHRHLSHLYALYPGNQIDLRATPALAQPARKVLERRLAHGGGFTGWSAAWIVNLWARLEEPEAAHTMLRQLLSNSTFPNLFNSYPPAIFQIDGNLGGAAGIAEMLLQSQAGEISLLPALPAAWPAGYVKGLRARGGYEVDIAWQDGRLTEARLRAGRDGRCRVRARGGFAVGCAGQTVATAGENEGAPEFAVRAGNEYALLGGRFG